MRVKSIQLCLTLCDPVDCSPLGCSVHGILQARTLEWVTVPSSFPDPSIEPTSLTSPALAGGFFTTSATSEDHIELYYISKMDVFSGFAQKFI